MYKIGDKVRVARVVSEERKIALGAVGTIIDVDYDWTYPYEIEFEGEYNRDVSEMLFMEEELLLIGMVKPSPQNPFINIRFQNNYLEEGASVEEVIDILVEKVKEMHNDVAFPSLDVHMSNINAISRLMEAKMWMADNRRAFEKNLENLKKRNGE